MTDGGSPEVITPGGGSPMVLVPDGVSPIILSVSKSTKFYKKYFPNSEIQS